MQKNYFELIKNELENANKNYPLFNSLHEGYAVIKEEFDELWEEIKKKNADMEKIENECVQVAAMCVKFLISKDKKNE